MFPTRCNSIGNLGYNINTPNYRDSIMTLLSDIIPLTEAKKRTTNNFVAKNSQSKSGAGAHEDKKGEKAKRSRRNANWKKDASKEM